MCGIAGLNRPDYKAVEAMAKSMAHRGPDAEGIFVDEFISLGHRRLSILDLSEKGKQPMNFENLWIVFNGEIYNFIEIRNELVDLGHKFKSQTDTEVILHAYKHWGDKCINRFNGMWAFCIYNQIEGTFFISRDRFGVKPLYFYSYGKLFLFASEIKAIRTYIKTLEISSLALNLYFDQKYIGGEHTIYNNIYKLQAGHNLHFDIHQYIFRIEKYYFIEDEIIERNKMGIAERLEQVEPILKDAVKMRLIADVPLGCFLSGGLDSSMISAIIAKNHQHFKTFSIGFKDQSYDETHYSKIVAQHLATDHTIDFFSIDDEVISGIIEKLDEPFGDSSLIPTYLLSKNTRKFVTVSLSGDAGDEVFGGYDSYLSYKVSHNIPSLLFTSLRKISRLLPVTGKKVSRLFKIRKFLEDYNPDPIERHLRIMSQCNSELRKKTLGDNFRNVQYNLPEKLMKGLTGIQLTDFMNYLSEDILKKVDIASMLCSLEARVPMLDYRLVPLVLSLPDSYKIHYFQTKFLLKKIALNYLPKQIVYRKKRGFTIPLLKMTEQSELILEYLKNPTHYLHGFIDFDTVHSCIQSQKHRNQNFSRYLWLVFVFNYWYAKTR